MIDSALLTSLTEKGELLDFEKGVNLLSVGSSLDSFIFVLEGEVKIYLSGPNDKRKTLYWLGNNECCLLGVNCLVNSTSYPASAMTTKDSKILMLPKKEFDLFMNSVEFRQLIFSMQSKRLDETLNLLMESSFHELDFRVARYLARKSDRISPLSITHREASEDLGASRERVSRSFKSLETKGLITSIEKGIYKVHVDDILDEFAM